MNNNNENKLVPKLRFPEFKDSGEWEKKLLRQVSNVISGQSPAGESYNEEGIGTPFYQGKTDFGDIFLKEPTKWTTEPTKFANAGDILMSVRAPVGALNISNQVICIGRGLAAIQSKDDKLYLFYFLNKIQNKIIGNGGSVFDSINKEQIEKINVLIPKKIKEQQKIAACLSSLDEVITAESQKLELLKEHKKGLLQNLFPQEGETVPKLRFKEFENSGEWEEKTVGDVYDFKVTNSLAREYLNYEDGSVKNIHYGDIHTKFNTLFDITKEDVPFINPDVSIEKIKNESYCIAGDIVFADASEDMNDVGKSIEIVNLNNEKLVSGLHTLLARQKEKKMAIGFGGYLFKSDWVRKQIQREAQGAKVLGISATRISNVQILYPNNSKEQQKIATCLSSIDDLITAQSQKIEALKMHKKGLLQGLFPEIKND